MFKSVVVFEWNSEGRSVEVVWRFLWAERWRAERQKVLEMAKE